MCCGDPSDCSKPCEPSHSFREWDEDGWHVIEETHVFSNEWMRHFYEEALKGGKLLLVSVPRTTGKVAASELIEAIIEEGLQ